MFFGFGPTTQYRKDTRYKTRHFLVSFKTLLLFSCRFSFGFFASHSFPGSGFPGPCPKGEVSSFKQGFLFGVWFLVSFCLCPSCLDCFLLSVGQHFTEGNFSNKNFSTKVFLFGLLSRLLFTKFWSRFQYFTATSLSFRFLWLVLCSFLAASLLLFGFGLRVRCSASASLSVCVSSALHACTARRVWMEFRLSSKFDPFRKLRKKTR